MNLFDKVIFTRFNQKLIEHKLTQLQLSLPETIAKVDALIDDGTGDAGRLYHILEFLKNNKTLYHSDQIYLENKLNSSFSVEAEPVEENYLLPKIKKLVDSGTGDPGRLQHIYDVLSNNKPLYHSDSIYLESKLNSSTAEPEIIQVESTPPKQVQDYIPPEPKEIPLVSKPASKIKGSMPKGWAVENKPQELDKITNNIKNEQHKIEEQQKITDEINLQRSNLSQLISHRKEYEQKINQEKSFLESQINDERIRIESQTNLSKEIMSQKQELAKVKKERVSVIKKIDSEKIKISKDLSLQKKQLVQAQLDQEKIEKQIQNEQVLLAKMASEQKTRLLNQAQIAHEIKLKQTELEKTRQDYDDIVSQVNEEKAKFAESKKFKTLIKTQEQGLIKAKEERLTLINLISKEKDLISKKTEDEKSKLKSQSELTAQLKKEEKIYNSLKKKREKIDAQIKTKNQKLKVQQEKLKKQIAEKDKKLKSLAKKPSSKKISKKPTVKKTKSKK